MPKLGISEHKILKNSKKGDFRHFFDQFLDFTLKRISQIDDLHILWKHFQTKIMIDFKEETIVCWFFIRYYFQLKKDILGGSSAKFRRE